MAREATGSDLLGLFERGLAAGPPARAALLAQAGGAAPDATLGDADRAAWAFLRRTFGPLQEAVLTCTACGEEVEFALPPDFDIPTAARDHVTLRHEGRDIALRLPRLSDLGTGPRWPDCLAPDGDWRDAEFRKRAEAALLEADPGLRLELNLACAACGAAQVHVFDVTAFVWTRVEQSARALIRDVARLAARFGWSEAEITAMSPTRRALYLREIAE